jgi:hypothetical protein
MAEARVGQTAVGGQGGSTAEQAQEKAGQAADQARGKVREQADQRSTQIGERISSNAGDARSVADELRKQGKETPARLAEQAADRADRVGSWLTESDGDRILRDVEDFGRRNPWAIAAGGLIVGFAASRMLKASSSERYRTSRGDGEIGRALPPAGQPAPRVTKRIGDGAGAGTAGVGVGRT